MKERKGRKAGKKRKRKRGKKKECIKLDKKKGKEKQEGNKEGKIIMVFSTIFLLYLLGPSCVFTIVFAVILLL